MKLSEMKKPEKAGVVKLQFGYKGKKESVPFRIGNKIVLPDDPSLRFFPLQRGKQFLIIDSGTVWFGGTDKQTPFFVAMDPEIISRVFDEKCERLNERAFYGLLKPRIITAIEEQFDVFHIGQGDLWAVPIPHSWDNISFNAFLSFGSIITKPKSARSFSIFKTHHRLNGHYIDLVDCGADDNDLFGHPPFFATGVVKAPNHPPMKLEGIHVLAQTEWLSSPTESD